MERCLVTLSEDGGGLKCKEYGKAKIFFIDQRTMESESSQAQLDQLDRDIQALKKETSQAQGIERQLTAELQGLQKEPTDENLERVLDEMTVRVNEKSRRVQSLSSMKMEPHAMKEAIKMHNHFRTVWKQRKDMCMEVVDSIGDSMGKKTEVVMREMGMETDKDVNINTIPPSLAELP